MKSKVMDIFWSIVLIAAGIVFLLRELGFIYFDTLSNTVWALIFAMLAAFFWLTYLLKGTAAWGWLFPAAIFSGIALVIGLEGTAVGEALSGAPILAAVALPFLAAYISDPKTRQWALIPAWVLSVLTVVVLVERFVSGELIGSLVLYSIALPFLVVFLQDRTRRWALIPFAVMAVVGTFPLLDMLISGDLLAVLVMLLLALPFFVVFFSTKNNWWALIPAGVFSSIALPLAVEALTGIPFPAGLLLAGMGLTFGLLWTMRASQPTAWAMFPAIGLLIAAGIVFFVESPSDIIGPLLLVVVGVVILLGSVIRKPSVSPPVESLDDK
jgi:hypothetical protein